MKFDLGFFLKRQWWSIVLLLACIFISLALSDIPFLVSNYTMKKLPIEGMETGSVVAKLNDILNDTTGTPTQQLDAIKSLVALMVVMKDQKEYDNILTDGKLNESDKIKAIKALVKDATSN
jgi:hypothetical protein